MTRSPTFTYGGALIVGTVIGVGFGVRMNSTGGGILIGVLAALGWLSAGFLWRARRS